MVKRPLRLQLSEGKGSLKDPENGWPSAKATTTYKRRSQKQKERKKKAYLLSACSLCKIATVWFLIRSFTQEQLKLFLSFKAYRKSSDRADVLSFEHRNIRKFGICFLLNGGRTMKPPILSVFGVSNFDLCCHGNNCVLIHLHREVFNRLWLAGGGLKCVLGWGTRCN